MKAAALLDRGRPVEALDELKEAQRLADLWIVRYLMGVAYVEARAYAEALSELELCEKRRGEATAVFLDDVPSYRYMVPLSYWLGRAHDGLGARDAAERHLAPTFRSAHPRPIRWRRMPRLGLRAQIDRLTVQRKIGAPALAPAPPDVRQVILHRRRTGQDTPWLGMLIAANTLNFSRPRSPSSAESGPTRSTPAMKFALHHHCSGPGIFRSIDGGAPAVVRADHGICTVDGTASINEEVLRILPASSGAA